MQLFLLFMLSEWLDICSLRAAGKNQDVAESVWDCCVGNDSKKVMRMRLPRIGLLAMLRAHFMVENSLFYCVILAHLSFPSHNSPGGLRYNELTLPLA